MMRLYGIRGATTVSANTSQEILRETETLIKAMVAANNLLKENIVSIILTTTPDLTAEFPAKACREMGWHDIPLLGAVEADVPHGVDLCIRILIHAYLEGGTSIKPVYLKEAQGLRPDLLTEV